MKPIGYILDIYKSIYILNSLGMKKELQMYELVLFFKVTLTEQELKSKMERYRDFLTEKGSQVMVKNNGKISLAYPIKNFDTAMYIQLIYLGNGSLITQLNTELQRDEGILRSVTTKLIENKIPTEFANA
jgi:ribosomal protein S6